MSNGSDKLLVISDSPHITSEMVELLNFVGYEVLEDESLKSPENAMEVQLVIVYFSDIFKSFNFIRVLKTSDKLKDLPVILAIENKDYDILFDAYQIGVSDFVELPIVDVELISKVALHIELKKNRKKLEDMYIELKNSLDIATQVQQMMLPSNIIVHNNVWVTSHYRPAQIVGGDIYDYFKIDGKIIGYIADISGHGVQSALLCSAVKSLVRSSAARSLNILDIVNELSESVKSVTSYNYITGIFFKIKNDGTVEYLNCGHPSVITYDGEKFKNFEMKHSLPINLFDYQYTQNDAGTFKLEKDFTYLFFSDGIYSPFERQSTSFSSFEMIIDYLNKNISGVASEVLPFYLENLLRKTYGNLYDDYSMMCIGLADKFIYKNQKADYECIECKNDEPQNHIHALVNSLTQHAYLENYTIFYNKHKNYSVILTYGVEVGYILRKLPMSVSVSFGDISAIKFFS